MVKPAVLDITIYQGATFRKSLQWKTKVNDVPVSKDITGCSARMQIRPTISSDDVFTTLTTENGGIIIVDAVEGKFEIYMTDEQTAALSFNAGVYDIEFENAAGDVDRPIGGSVTLDLEVTRT